MDTVAMWLGYGVMVAAGLALTALLIWLSAEAVYQWAKNAYGLYEMVKHTRAARRAQETTNGEA